MSPSEVLIAAAAKIEHYSGFVRDSFARRPGPKPSDPSAACMPSDPEAFCWNAPGAVWAVPRVSKSARRAAWEALSAEVGDGGSLFAWALNADHGEQVEALRRAAARSTTPQQGAPNAR